jgi:hypothetical protein
MFSLHAAAAMPVVIAGIINATWAHAASVRVGDAVQIVREVKGLQSGNQKWDDKGKGDDVYENERVRTAVESQAQILLVDRTDLSIGPITEIRVDRILYNPNKSIKGMIVSVDSGTLRWTSGASRLYLIGTPTAELTPMGTAFDLFVDHQRTFVILREGRVKVCTKNQQKCKTLAKPGEMMLATAGDLQGPGRGGPEPADFASRCLSATGRSCAMNLTYSPPQAPQRKALGPKRADAQPYRTQADERKAPVPRRVDVQPRQTQVVDEYVVPQRRYYYHSRYASQAYMYRRMYVRMYTPRRCMYYYGRRVCR